MKGWLIRAQANTARRGEKRPRFAPWSTWFRQAGLVPDDRFQGDDEPHPRHWSVFPEEWPAEPWADASVQERLRVALHRLPATWRAVVILRDVAGRTDSEIASELGISRTQARNMLARARATLREDLDAMRHPGVRR